ncbi:hypothetical protein FB446DRAFT_733673 [Lentinula raphanica]|nr:hypothetical protein FB446DRAFT_733673 [Lentinula raphanica]
MSRRESRVSMNARQNDALFEFESFKKKFLLANKHITKLNSTLSVRIEELNAQISTLYTENLRLRASEINLAAQLKREREKSRKVIAETEAAVSGLTKHLGFLRQAFSIPENSHSPSFSSPTPPRATQRPQPSADSPNSPVYPRLSRAPTIPLIYEDDEPSDPTEDDEPSMAKMPSLRHKNKAKRLSASRLPLPSRTPSPLPTSPSMDQFVDPSAKITKRRPLRNHSGLLVRQGSPVVGSHEAEEDDQMAAELDGPDDLNQHDQGQTPAVRKEKRKSSKDKGKEKEREHDALSRKKLRDGIGDERKKLKLEDVTNSPRNRPSQPVDIVVSEVELEITRLSSNRPESFSPSPPRLSSSSLDNDLATSSSPLQLANSNETDHEFDAAPTGGRERRTRKSVNYAEPKLNTKMRKPDSEPVPSSSRKRKSTVAAAASRSEDKATTDDGDESAAGGRSSMEGPGSQTPRSINRLTDPAQYPLPASRPGSSADTPFQPLASATSTTSSSSRRTKPRSYLYTAEDDVSSQSDDADTEYVPSSGAGKANSTWVNMSARKKGGRRSATEDDGARRHSSAV